jgi:predicted RNA-binding protein YlqC (UPF0109 family)
MEDLISFLVRNLVEDPGATEVRRVPGEKTDLYEIRVGSADQGRLIGKSGRTIRSVRAVVNAAAARKGKRAMVEVLE